MLVRIGGKVTLIHCLWKCKLVYPPCKSVWRILKELKTELLYDPVILLLGMYSKESKLISYTNIHIVMFITALFILVKLWNQPQCPLEGEKIKKMLYINTTEFCLAIKTNELVCLLESGWNLRSSS
jgi:hypothetical protein